MLDKNTLKENLSLEEVFNYVESLGGEPKKINEKTFISKTICHNPIEEGQHKLYYYDNTHLFHCYTDCGDSFDIYDLTKKVYKQKNKDYSLKQAIFYVADYFGVLINEENAFLEEQKELSDWTVFNKNENLKKKIPNQIVQFKHYKKDILSNYPQPHIKDWELEGISYETLKNNNIHFNPIDSTILIPHYNKDNQLIGIRQRTLVKEDEIFGKYRPAYLKGNLYNHPLGFNLYNLNNSKINIQKFQKAILFEGEKSCLKYNSYFGKNNDISVACCGSSLLLYQVFLLLEEGVKEIIIGFDKQFKENGDPEFQKWVKKLINFNDKYSSFVKISFLFDKENNLLDYKDSPIDKGKEIFLQLYKNRIYI